MVLGNGERIKGERKCVAVTVGVHDFRYGKISFEIKYGSYIRGQ